MKRYTEMERRERKMIMAGRVIAGCGAALLALIAITYLS